jgi:hypothetical protein
MEPSQIWTRNNLSNNIDLRRRDCCGPFSETLKEKVALRAWSSDMQIGLTIVDKQEWDKDK